MAGNKINPKGSTKKLILNSVVQRINSDIKNGNSFYYFTVEGRPNIFIGSSQISNELPVTFAGDSIAISFDDDTQGLIDISSFKNRSIGEEINFITKLKFKLIFVFSRICVFVYPIRNS